MQNHAWRNAPKEFSSTHHPNFKQNISKLKNKITNLTKPTKNKKN
jgi:hypothetical protein